MAVIVGADGAAQIDLGNGLKYMANITSWSIRLDRGYLDRTDLSHEAKKRTAGLADWTGDFSFNIQLSEDTSVALSAWQLLQFIIAGRDDELKAEVALILQRNQVMADCNIFQTTIPGAVWLAGTVVIGSVGLDCEDPEKPLVGLAQWGADGALTLHRS